MKRILLAGATGLIGREATVLLNAPGQNLHILARKPTGTNGANVTEHVADSKDWPDFVQSIKPDIIISCLGTTWNKSGKDETAFRAVDLDLVVSLCSMARVTGAKHCITVSSVGASSQSSNFYLRTKGEMEKALRGMDFERLDILRPGLLVGERKNDRRLGERLGILLSPVTDMLLHGSMRRYRSISALAVANAIKSLTGNTAPGQFIHENDALHKLGC